MLGLLCFELFSGACASCLLAHDMEIWKETDRAHFNGSTKFWAGVSPRQRRTFCQKRYFCGVASKEGHLCRVLCLGVKFFSCSLKHVFIVCFATSALAYREASFVLYLVLCSSAGLGYGLLAVAQFQLVHLAVTVHGLAVGSSLLHGIRLRTANSAMAQLAAVLFLQWGACFVAQWLRSTILPRVILK